MDKKKPASPEGDGFPQCSSVLRGRPAPRAPNRGYLGSWSFGALSAHAAFRTSAHLCSARLPHTQLSAHQPICARRASTSGGPSGA